MRLMPEQSSRMLFGAVAALALLAPAVSVRADDDDPKPVTDKSVSATDVAKTPLADLNLSKDAIPQILLDAEQDPYTTAGLKKCSQYARAIGDLDAVLGADFDIATPEQRRLTAGSVAQAVVGSLIPFRGVIRELSGAAKHEAEFRQAILAGMMRRGFLKGVGLKMGCPYPARPADAKVRARIAAQADEKRGKHD
jgi:hypothetical protein